MRVSVGYVWFHQGCAPPTACSTHRILEPRRERERRDLLVLVFKCGHDFVGIAASLPKQGPHADFVCRHQHLHRLMQLVGASTNIGEEQRRLNLLVPGNKAEPAGDRLQEAR